MSSNDIAQVIDEVIRFYRHDGSKLSDFQTLKHDDHLCPRVETQLDNVLSCFQTYRNLAHDIQGIRDRGTDVAVRLFASEDTSGGETEYICIQIKSFNDLKDTKYLQTLKSQCYETQQTYKDRLIHYYILLCTDPSQHEDKIRSVKAEFIGNESVTVVEPAYVWTLINLGHAWIKSVVENCLNIGDAVRREARNTLLDLTPSEAELLIAAVCMTAESPARQITLAQLRASSLVSDAYCRIPDYERNYFFYLDELAATNTKNMSGDILRQLETDSQGEVEDFDDDDFAEYEAGRTPNAIGRGVESRFAAEVENIPISIGDSDDVEFQVELVRPIEVLVLDAMVRYGLRGGDLAHHIIASLRIGKAFEYHKWNNVP